MSTPKTKPCFKKKPPQVSELDQRDKLMINQLKTIISEKIKSPEMAKKAARIIEEMISR